MCNILHALIIAIIYYALHPMQSGCNSRQLQNAVSLRTDCSLHCMPTACSLPACSCIFRLHAACTACRLHAGMQSALHAVPTASGPGRLQPNHGYDSRSPQSKFILQAHHFDKLEKAWRFPHLGKTDQECNVVSGIRRPTDRIWATQVIHPGLDQLPGPYSS